MANKKVKFKQVKSLDKVSLAVEAVQNLIIGENLPVGAELPTESEMAEQIGVSKFSMREALRVLQIQGIIKITRGRRSTVAKPTVKPIIDMVALTLKRTPDILGDLMEARKIFDVKVAGIAACKATEKDIEALENIIENLQENKEDLSSFAEHDLAFHNTLTKISDNKVFEIMTAPLAELQREQQEKNKGFRSADEIINDHKKILEALKKRNPETAEKVMLKHLENAEKDLKKAVNT